MDAFRAPRWLPGGHVQTIWPVFFSRRFDGAKPVFRRERWATPDADFSKWVKPIEIARVIRFLLSDDAKVTSGGAIPVYGQA